MASREEQKRRAREERAAAELAETAAGRRRQRLFLLGGILVIAVIVVGALVLVSQASDSGDTDATASGSLDGIPERGIALGDPKAPVTLVEFADPQCPYCAQYTRDVLPDLVDRYVKAGKLRMELRLVTFLGAEDSPDDSTRLASAAYSAADQDGLWKFIELAYARQGTEHTGYATDEFIRSVAADTGLNADQVMSDADSAKVAGLIAAAKAKWQDAGLDSTPSFLIGPTGGTLAPLDFSSLTVGSFTGPIDDALSAAGAS